MDIEKLNDVPKSPGVYLWKNKYKDIIYIGKAKNLFLRMRQYFQKVNNNRTSKLVSEIDNFEYIITKNEKDALILERNLITKNKPRYNVLLTDDKRYPYIRIKFNKTLDIKIVRKYKKESAEYFGPFPNGYGAWNVYKLLVRLTQYKNGLPYNDLNDYEHWKRSYELCHEILKPTNQKFKKNLEKKMYEAAEKFQYEIANDLKETIKSLDFYIEQSYVDMTNQDDFDVLGIVSKNDYLSVSIMVYRNGKLLSKIDKVVKLYNNIDEVVSQFINQYYSINFKPTYILLSDEFGIDEEIFDFKIIKPIKGNKKKILEVAENNAKDNIDKKLQKFIRLEERTINAISSLQTILKLKNLYHIAMIDNSHFNNLLPISVIVSYKNGVKQKSEYLKFNLKEAGGDTKYMSQALNRYLKKVEKLPDLFIVDGGLQQLSEMKKALKNNNIKFNNIAALVKDEKHKTKSLLNSEGYTVNIDNDNLSLFLSEMQFEVDRFAKSHQRKRRIKSSLSGKLDQIKGIGDATINKLLNEFETFSGIYNATIEELEQVVSKEVAKKIKETLL
ncbi:MAG: excinuclease ABC subunit UvrC [Mycoplasma sp.]|nr:excinuclease ABC subunit UvrC [Mycoplasma sp.]